MTPAAHGSDALTEPADVHDLQCSVWTTTEQPCDCDQVRSPDLALPAQPRLTPVVALPCDADDVIGGSDDAA